MPHEISDAMRQCIDDCRDCHRICTETAAHCLDMGGAHAAAEHIRLLLDCAQICHTAADFMLRGSPQHTAVCGVCADICDRCAASCERFGGDVTMAECAEVCRRCARSCREMAGTKVRAAGS